MKDTKEIKFKIFLTVFIIYVLFVHSVGWYEESRIALIKSICREGRFEIDKYANFTGDRSKYDGHYYSDRAPGTSLLGVPICFISNSIFGHVTSHMENMTIVDPQFNTTIYTPIDMPAKEYMDRILIVVFLSSLPGALLIMLIYKMSKFFIEKESYRIFSAFSFGLGTLIFPYSTVILGSIIGTLFGFSGFYIIFRIQRKLLEEKYIFIAGLLLGFSIIIEYLMIVLFISMSLVVFVSKKLRKNFLYFLIGGFIGILPLIIYNTVIFSSPLKFTFFYLDTDIFCFKSLIEILKSNIDYLIIGYLTEFPRLLIAYLFLPYRGVFFYNPIIFITILGFYYLRKKDKATTKILLLILSLFLISGNPTAYWFGGNSFGLRYMVPLIPFLSIPFSSLLERIQKRNFLKIILFIVFSISVFHNFLGFSAPWEGLEYIFHVDDGNPVFSGFVSLKWGEKRIKVPSFEERLLNPLYDYYLPNFIKNGPRSRVLEGLLYNPSKTDIRDFKPMAIRKTKLFSLSPFGILVLKIPFLIIPILLSSIILIWRKELFRIFVFKKISLGVILVGLTILLFASRLTVKNIVHDKNWYPSDKDEPKWMSENARFYLFSLENKNYTLNISLTNYRGKTLDLYLNHKLINSYKATSKILQKIKLRKGVNVLRFNSREGCEIPVYVENQIKCKTKLECFGMNISVYNLSYDPRCLSFGLENIKLIARKEIEKENGTIYFGRLNWYPPQKDGRWSAGDSNLFLPLEEVKNARMNISASSHPNSRFLKIYVNKNFIGEYKIYKNLSNIITTSFQLEKGENIIFLNTSTCVLSNKSGEPNDIRCLSFFLKDISFIFKDVFYDNFFEEELFDNITFRWMPREGIISFLVKDEGIYRLDFDSWGFDKKREVDIYLDNKMLQNIIITKKKSKYVLPFIYLSRGAHSLKFLANSCDYPENNQRCLSIAISNFTMDNTSFLVDKLDDELDKNWYKLEKDDKNRSFRWISQNGGILFFNPTNEERDIKLKFIIWNYYRNRTLFVFLNGKNIKNIEISKELPLELNLKLNPKLNELRFHSEEGCESPSELEGLKDNRCLSFGFRDLKINNTKK